MMSNVGGDDRDGHIDHIDGKISISEKKHICNKRRKIKSFIDNVYKKKHLNSDDIDKIHGVSVFRDNKSPMWAVFEQ